jgi:TatD DNase family protein
MLVDTHCHLYASDFEPDISQVMVRAREAGVRRVVVPGTDIASSHQALQLAGQYEEVYCAVGVHPHEAEHWEHSTLAELYAMSASPKVVAIGEIGLDYYRNYSSKAAQERAFRRQLDLAADLELPVIVHNREATEDVLSQLLRWSIDLPARLVGRAGVLHAYSAGERTAEQATEAGFYIGVAGPVTYANADQLRDVVIRLPPDRMLIETDAPYLPPHPHRGERNEPCYVALIAVQLARVRGIDLTASGLTTSQNASILFGWDDGN